MKNIFVTGIGTDVGKTVVSAILVEALGMDYWKPIQAGDLNNTDSMKVRKMIQRTNVKIHKEYIQLMHSLSPHVAASMENKEIDVLNIKIPESNHGIVIEGAGGVLVPLNREHNMIDLIEQLKVDVIVVTRHYLGSINHSLLTMEALSRRNIHVLGWVCNDQPDTTTEEIIQVKTGKPVLFSILPEKEITQNIIKKYAEQFLKSQKIK